MVNHDEEGGRVRELAHGQSAVLALIRMELPSLGEEEMVAVLRVDGRVGAVDVAARKEAGRT
jgi:hypothetical protein